MPFALALMAMLVHQPQVVSHVRIIFLVLIVLRFVLRETNKNLAMQFLIKVNFKVKVWFYGFSTTVINSEFIIFQQFNFFILHKKA